ncbi:MAG: 5-formyltetrahydrofolate cyclo-ligase [Gammaproteobacteria bacterium]|nr:5-formyltetrahydrofolate cyclo-ligase [Gammaproteobacteria bacterium]
MKSRQQLRDVMRRNRRALSPLQRVDCAQQFAYHFSKTGLFVNSQHVAFYMANDAELDPLPLMHIAWSMGKTCYLPVLSAAYQKRLLFSRYNRNAPVVFNRYGIAEPVVAACDRVRAQQLDLVLTPLVAFDTKGNRIGMGGGFYDRSFAFLRQRQHWIKPRLIGIGYSFQQIDAIQCQSWDVPLSAIATDKGLMSTIR